MLSSMESTPSPAEASAALADADAARTALAHGIVTPPWFSTSLAGAVTVQIATAAVGLGADVLWPVALGAAVFAAVAAVQLARFRRLNGVWLGRFASRVVLGGGMLASLSYAVAACLAIWSGYEERWWLVAVCSLAGGAAYALSGRRWLRTYRAQPAVHGRGESLAWLAALVVVAVAALALLVVNA
jgi:hypothetical protein